MKKIFITFLFVSVVGFSSLNPMDEEPKSLFENQNHIALASAVEKEDFGKIKSIYEENKLPIKSFEISMNHAILSSKLEVVKLLSKLLKEKFDMENWNDFMFTASKTHLFTGREEKIKRLEVVKYIHEVISNNFLHKKNLNEENFLKICDLLRVNTPKRGDYSLETIIESYRKIRPRRSWHIPKRLSLKPLEEFLLKTGYFFIIETIIKYFNKNITDFDKFSLVYAITIEAAEKNLVETFRSIMNLIKSDQTLDKTKIYKSSMIIALEKGNFEIIKLLSSLPFDLESWNEFLSESNTAYYLSSTKDKELGIIKYLYGIIFENFLYEVDEKIFEKTCEILRENTPKRGDYSIETIIKSYSKKRPRESWHIPQNLSLKPIEEYISELSEPTLIKKIIEKLKEDIDLFNCIQEITVEAARKNLINIFQSMISLVESDDDFIKELNFDVEYIHNFLLTKALENKSLDVVKVLSNADKVSTESVEDAMLSAINSLNTEIVNFLHESFYKKLDVESYNYLLEKTESVFKLHKEGALEIIESITKISGNFYEETYFNSKSYDFLKKALENPKKTWTSKFGKKKRKTKRSGFRQSRKKKKKTGKKRKVTSKK